MLFVLLLLLAAGVTACDQNQTASVKKDYGFTFKDITKEAGIDFVHQKPQFDKKAEKIMPWLASTGAAVSVGDYNGDGFMDLYFVNSKKGSKNALYENNGDGTFTEKKDLGITAINQKGISTTAVWFDYDNDGKTDLFVGGWKNTKLFKNLGNGTFKDVTKKANLDFEAYTAKAIALDYNKDGYLDLYIGNYFRPEIDLWNLNTSKIMHNDFEKARNGGPNILYKNNGDGTFTDVTKETNTGDTGWTLATGAADINGDGWPDLYNANDFGPDVVYINKKGKGYEKLLQPRGVGDDTYKGMNVDFADIFHDGRLSAYISNVSKERYIIEGNQLWYPSKSGKFLDKAEEMGVHRAGFSWGGRFMDINNSGEMSLMVTNGFISASKKDNYWFELGTLATTPGNIIEDYQNWPKIGDQSLSGYEKKHLFLNNGHTFKNVTQDVGINFIEDGRGAAAIDLDNDGDLDLVFANQGFAPKVYKNQMKEKNHWIKLNLIGNGTTDNRDGVGAKVYITANGKKTLIERDGGNSHGAQSDPRIHFGLKKSKKADKITVIWPSGIKQEFRNIKGDQILTIKEPKH